MGAKARLKRERNAEAARHAERGQGGGKKKQAASAGPRGNAPATTRGNARRIALIATAAVVVVGAAAAFIVSFRAPSATPQEPAGASSAALPASSGGTGSAAGGAGGSGAAAATDLEKAADAVGFHITTGAEVGVIEGLPGNTTLLPPSRSLLPVGVPAPDFTLLTPEGKPVRLSDYRGKTVFLEFFATWCPHCQAEAPHLLRIFNTLPSSNVAFLSVNGDSEDAASIHAFTRQFGLPWPALMDPGDPPGSFVQQGGIGPVSRDYGLDLFPTFYIIDAKGRVAWRADREQPDALVLQKLRDVAGS